MPLIQHNGLRYFQFDTLQTRHAIFTRHGGVSPEPWGSLNVGGTVGDDLERVRENRLLSFYAMGRAPESAFEVWQVHSADVVCARAPRPQGESLRQADIILSGGSESVISESGVGGFNAMKALSERNDDPKTASRPYDKDRDGFVMGEGTF